MRGLLSGQTPRLRAEGPALYQPGPKRGTSVGPGLEAKTRRGPKARSIGCLVCVRFSAGLSALSPRVETLLGRCPRLGWSRAFGPQSRRSGLTHPCRGGNRRYTPRRMADDRSRFARERKVRTPPGSRPWRIHGHGGRKPDATDSVTETRPPGAQVSGKGETAG